MNERNHLHVAEENELVLTRTFKAPRDLLFRVWTDPKHLAGWWGPKGFAIEIAKQEVRPGGMFLYNQRSPEGQVMWGKFVYHEVAEPEKLVFVNSFSDEEGNTVRAPFHPNWPLEIVNNLTFEETQPGQTTLTMRGGPVNATPEELEVFRSSRPMLQQGFGGTFEQLDQYLASL